LRSSLESEMAPATRGAASAAGSKTVVSIRVLCNTRQRRVDAQAVRQPALTPPNTAAAPSRSRTVKVRHEKCATRLASAWAAHPSSPCTAPTTSCALQGHPFLQGQGTEEACTSCRGAHTCRLMTRAGAGFDHHPRPGSLLLSIFRKSHRGLRN
jgi:hypothetical protein